LFALPFAPSGDAIRARSSVAQRSGQWHEPARDRQDPYNSGVALPLMHAMA
jgi:hypothetical protein